MYTMIMYRLIQIYFIDFVEFVADEIDAIGTKRFDSETSGDREVQRTMLELLNQLDGFGSDENIKVSHGYEHIWHTNAFSLRLILKAPCDTRSLRPRIVQTSWTQH